MFINILSFAGCLHAVRQHHSAFGGGHEFQGSPTVRVHGAQVGRIFGEIENV